ncbi:sensor histidine kinase [Compostibacter hankyongensis]|uniref:histidine kinase n=1 Tax=Compostibacter hankyongensis TaxID=1007089 RepID=A0ABP8FP01_9BACT
MDAKEIRLFFLRHGYLLITAAWLVTIAFLVNNYWLYYSSPAGVRNSLEKNLQRRELEFNKLCDDTSLMRQLLNRDYDEALLRRLTRPQSDFHFFVFNGEWETFWSTNSVDPRSLTAHRLTEGSHFQKLKSGYYEIIRKNLSEDGQQYILGIVPVKEEYYFTNSYLPNRYYQLSRIGREYVINQEGEGQPVHTVTGRTLFYLEHLPTRQMLQPSGISGILKMLATLCILIFVNLFAVFIGRRSNPWVGFFFLAAFLFLIRLISYVSVFPFAYRSYALFDPKIYASSNILQSLGDLFINVVLVFWLILYFRTQLGDRLKLPEMPRRWKYLLTVALSFIMYYTGQFFSHIVQTLVIDSKISFDVTDFFSLNFFSIIYSIIGFVVLGLIAFCFFFFSQIVNRLLDQLTGERYTTKYIILGLVGLLWLLLRVRNPELGYSVGLMIWLLAYIFLLDIIHQRISPGLSTIPFIFWLLLLTVTTTAILVYYNNQRELENREQVARRLSKQKDPTLEFNLEVINNNLLQDPPLRNFLVTRDSAHKRDLEERLLASYFGRLDNRYEVSFYTYDDTGRAINNVDTTGIRTFNYVLENRSEPSSSPNLYFHETSFNNYSYIARLPVYDTVLLYNFPQRRLDGFLYYRLTPKTFKKESLYPELLTKTEDYNLDLNLDKYSYAVYDKLQLVSNHNDYPFPLQLSMKDVPLMEFSYRDEDGFSQLWYKPTKDKVVVIVRRNRNVIEAITLFAYMFCIFLVLAGIYRLFDMLIRVGMRPAAIRDMIRITIRVQIHGLIIFIVAFAFVILGVSTISFFINRYDKNHRDKLSKDINILLADVQKVYHNFLEFDDTQHFYSPAFQSRLQTTIQNIADTHGVDINIYDLDGNLDITTQNLIFENGLLSAKMDPLAYYKLHYMKQVQVTQKEDVGNLDYLSSYAPIRDYNGETLAYLNRPYFTSETDLNQEISNFLVALINLNAFIFLLSGLLAVFITNSITRSFTLISEKFSQVNLSRQNEEIEWHRDDEIGMLVREYNKMVNKLEESAAMLAKSEREGAWREMARQIAHEIKNPLTPMKLSLQYLQKAMGRDNADVRSLAENVARTLIEQIEHLSQIASDFSAFANIAYAHNEVLSLNEVLHSVVSLFGGYANARVEYHEPEERLYVYADKTQLNRVFTNLLQNAVQSIPEERIDGLISITAVREGDHVVAAIRDNGTGIPEEARARIFTPNFTTKSSGTGLGLAMCKNMVERAKGRIWFETETDTGSTFFVQLPLVPDHGQGALPGAEEAG